MVAQYDPTIHLGHEVNQDNIQRPHLVNPVHWVLDQGVSLPHLHYSAVWGDGTGHRVLFLFLAHHYEVPASAPTFNGVSMTPLGTPNTNGGLWYLANPATEGDFSFPFGTGGGHTTALAVMFVGARQIAPHGVNQYAGSWDSTVNLGIGVGHGSRQSCLTFLSTTKAHGVISCSDQYVLRPGDGILRASVTQSATVFGTGTHTATYAGTVAESSDYEAYGVALFQVIAGNGTQSKRPDQECRIYAPSLEQSTIEDQALRRLPAQFDKSTVLRAMVGACTNSLDEAARAVGNLPRLANVEAAYATNLDKWGARLGVPRLIEGNRVIDRIYRRLVLAAFLAYTSTGTYPEIRAVAQLLFPGADLAFSEPGSNPAITLTVGTVFNTTEGTIYKAILDRAVAPGVPLTLVSSP